MFSRRSFFKALGSTILGTAIALKIPETLIPSANILPQANTIPLEMDCSYRVLRKAKDLFLDFGDEIKEDRIDRKLDMYICENRMDNIFDKILDMKENDYAQVEFHEFYVQGNGVTYFVGAEEETIRDSIEIRAPGIVAYYNYDYLLGLIHDNK